MNNKEYIAALAGKLGYPQEQTQKMAKTLIEAMGHHFENGESVVVNGFGTFEVRKRLERVIINPASDSACWFLPNSYWDSNRLPSSRINIRREEESSYGQIHIAKPSQPSSLIATS